MCFVTVYEERYDPENDVYYIDSSEKCFCDKCGRALKYRDRVSRLQRYEDGRKQKYMISRMKC